MLLDSPTNHTNHTIHTVKFYHTIPKVRFVGETNFATGFWVGVELETPDGKNNGAVAGVQYFR